MKSNFQVKGFDHSDATTESCIVINIFIAESFSACVHMLHLDIEQVVFVL